QIVGRRNSEHGDQGNEVDESGSDLDRLDQYDHDNERRRPDHREYDSGRVHGGIGDDLDTIVIPVDLTGARARARRMALRDRFAPRQWVDPTLTGNDGKIDKAQCLAVQIVDFMEADQYIGPQTPV